MGFDIAVRRLATLGTTFSVALVGLTVVVGLVSPDVRRTIGLGSSQEPSYAVGDQLDVPADLYGLTTQTLIVFSRSSCRACQDAKPVLAKIAKRLAGVPDVRVVLATSQSTSADEIRFAEVVGLDQARLIGVDLRSLRLRRVPTIVLVDRSGTIQYVREGNLSDADAEALVLTVTAPAR